jgi:microcystin-dependent protein
MSDDLDVLGGMITPETNTGGGVSASFDTGTVTEVIDATHVRIDLGDKEVKALVPQTISGAAPVDATVRVSTQENTYVVDSVVDGAGAGTVPVGSIVMWATATPPDGWLTLDGGTYSSAAYPALFAVLGTTTLPNMADRAPVGKSGTKTVTTTGGAASITLTEAQLPVHDHSLQGHTHSMQNHTHSHQHDHGMRNHTHGMSHTHTVYGQIFADNNDHSNTGRFSTGDSPTVHDTTTSSSSISNTGAPSINLTDENTAEPNTQGPSTNTTGGASTSLTGNAGSGSAITIQNPYIALNFIIKAK